MSKILVIGNVLKDVYLKLDERQNNFEQDERGIDWLDLSFNGAEHRFFRRTSVYGGAAVTLSVLGRLGINSQIMGSNAEYKNGEIIWQGDPAGYRYIFCHHGEITYFVPSERKATDWQMPKDIPEWILVDRSTFISERLVDEIKNFRKFSPTTKLAVHAERDKSPLGQRLAEMADLLFIEEEPPVHSEEKIVDKIDLGQPEKRLVCHITPQKIIFGEAEESWQLSRTDMMTHLTVYNTIVATILGVISSGGSLTDAVLWARINAEQATLDGSLSGRRLKELVAEERQKRANVTLVAKSLMASRRGILAADEDDQTLTKRLVSFGIGVNTKTRADYRKLLLTTPELSEYTSGVILTAETARSKVQHAQTYLKYLTSRGIITGVKADRGQAHLKGTHETYTLGLDDLASRLREYYDEGFRFAKWHAKFIIKKDQPSYIAVEKNAKLLADFARECQLAGLVPMIESDISWSGDYSIEKSIEVTDRVLLTIFRKLERRGVDLSSVILKTSVVAAGDNAVSPSTPREVGIATGAVLKHAVPKYIAGIEILSGGQESKAMTQNLSAIIEAGPYDWPVSFAFSRALQDPVMRTWKGKEANIKVAQATLRNKLQDLAMILR